MYTGYTALCKPGWGVYRHHCASTPGFWNDTTYHNTTYHTMLLVKTFMFAPGLHKLYCKLLTVQYTVIREGMEALVCLYVYIRSKGFRIYVIANNS